MSQRHFYRREGGGGQSPNWDTLVPNDIPNLDFSKITTGSVPLVQGGTASDLSATGGTSQVLKQSSVGAPITVGQLSFSDISGTASLGQLPTITIAKGGTGQITQTAGFDALSPLTTLGDTTYHDGTHNVRLAGNTTSIRKFYRQTGTGSVSAAPAWDTLAAGDIPNLDASIITSGQLALARGGTNVDLSATGGAHQVLQQASAGGNITVGQLATTDLSDISSGTWTPVLAGQTTAGTQTYTDQHGIYMKIGKIVYVSCSISLSAFDPTTAGNVNVTGLPFTSVSSGPLQFIANAYFTNVTLSAGYSQFVGTVGLAKSQFSLVEIGSGVAQHRLQPSQFSNTSSVLLTGMYQIP